MRGGWRAVRKHRPYRYIHIHEPLCGQFRVIEITAGEPLSGNVQLAGGVFRAGPHLIVEYQQSGVVYGCTDGHAGEGPEFFFTVSFDLEHSGDDSGFGGSVHVE